MKRHFTFLLLFCGVSMIGLGQKLYHEMTKDEWSEDLQFLNNKIQKEFNSYVPGIKERFNTEVEQIMDRLPELSNHEVPCEIMRTLSTLDDGHTELNIGHRTVGFHRVPISLYIFEGVFRVVAAHESHSDLIGSQVIAVGNQPIDSVFKKLTARMSRDNEMEYLHAAPGYIILTELLNCVGLSPNLDQASFVFQKEDGSTVNKTFQGVDVNEYNEGPWVTYRNLHNIELPMYLSNRADSYWYQYLTEENTMYFHISRMNNQKGKPSIKKISKKVFDEIDRRKPEKLIIDLRLNNGGNYNRSYPIIEGIVARDWLNQKGKVWAVTSRRTFSAASSMCIFLKQQTNTQIIGEVGRTHPNKSDNNEYMSLPNSDILIEYTTRLRKKWPERPELDRVPVDVEIKTTFENYMIGKDAVLEFLLKND